MRGEPSTELDPSLKIFSAEEGGLRRTFLAAARQARAEPMGFGASGAGPLGVRRRGSERAGTNPWLQAAEEPVEELPPLWVKIFGISIGKALIRAMAKAAPALVGFLWRKTPQVVRSIATKRERR